MSSPPLWRFAEHAAAAFARRGACRRRCSGASRSAPSLPHRSFGECATAAVAHRGAWHMLSRRVGAHIPSSLLWRIAERAATSRSVPLPFLRIAERASVAAITSLRVLPLLSPRALRRAPRAPVVFSCRAGCTGRCSSTHERPPGKFRAGVGFTFSHQLCRSRRRLRRFITSLPPRPKQSCRATYSP